MTAVKFTSDMLAEIECAFYRGSKQRFLQDREDLLKAILLPVDYIHSQRDLVASAGHYSAIVRAVIKTIREHGTPDPRRRFSLYFLKCMQTHLQHHGEDYLRAAKSVSALSVTGARSLCQTQAIEITSALNQAHRALRIRAGRKKPKKMAYELDLFEPCKGVAAGVQATSKKAAIST